MTVTFTPATLTFTPAEFAGLKGEFKLLWMSDVEAHYEVEHCGAELFASKGAAERDHPVIRESTEEAVPVLVFVPLGATEAKVLESAKALLP